MRGMSLQEARETSPKVQKTVAAIWLSSAKYCRNMVPAVKRELRATPARIIPSGMPLVTDEMTSTTPMQRREARKAAPVVSHGLTMVTAFTALLCMLPVPSTMMENAAPKAAALDRPRVKGEPRGFRSADCITAPARESPPPAMRAARV